MTPALLPPSVALRVEGRCGSTMEIPSLPSILPRGPPGEGLLSLGLSPSGASALQPAQPAGCLHTLITAGLQTEMECSMRVLGNRAVHAGCQAHFMLHLNPQDKMSTAFI